MADEGTQGTVRVGTAGWSYDDWKGIVYPRTMPRGEHPLELMARLFDTVEINSTFYRPPQTAYCSNWLKRVGENERFKFTVKLWRRFTHERDSWPSESEQTFFKKSLAPLVDAGKLGGLLVQFPWSFKNVPDNRKWLTDLFEAFAEYPLALEIRHASWNVPEMYESLAEKKVAFCNIDQPLFSGSLRPSAQVTAKVGYVRLHGQNYENWFKEDAGRDARYDYLYSEEELDPWVEKIQNIRKIADDVYVITNNHYCGQAVVNAFQILNKLTGDTFDIPDSLVDMYPQLKRIARDTGQMTLDLE
jgi:uncharacterized protein YecE (DUF72 family)